MTISEEENAFVNVAQYAHSVWPSFLPQFEDNSILEHVWFRGFETTAEEANIKAKTTLLFDKEIALSIPGVDAIKIVFAAGEGGTIVPIEIGVIPAFYLKIFDIPIALRLKSDLFKPAKRIPSSQVGQPDIFEIDTEKEYLEIVLAKVTAQVDDEGNIEISTDGSIDLPSTMIGDSGVVIEAEDIQLYLNTNSPPPGKPTGWRGLYIARAKLYLPGELAGISGVLEITDAYIGNGGFSGTVSNTWTPALHGRLFGMDVTLNSVALTFVQNSLTESSIIGTITLPFFDEPAEIELGFSIDGGLTAILRNTTGGLYTLTKPGILQIKVESLGFKVEDGSFKVILSGDLTPEFGAPDLVWPTFKVNEMIIDSNGNVHLEGGWLDIPTQKSFDLYGFSVNITKIGFGNEEDGAKWIGLSGGIKLVDGLPLEGSVEGLRIKWKSSTDIELDVGGIRVAFEIKDVLKFDGSVTFIDEPTKKGFKGGIKIILYPFDGCSLDAQLVVGKNTSTPSYTFFYTYISADLPVGIPLFSTGLALYGMAGLFGYNIEPSRGKAGNPNEGWYENPDGSPGWYLRDVPGITDASTKWLDKFESIAFGAGITIGTLPDNGFKFSAKTLIALLIPGPVIIVEGKANFLKERKKLDENPLFRVLAVYDNRVGTFLMNIEVNYSLPEATGNVITIRALAEAFFDFNNSQNWHLYIGQDQPDSKRIRAEILKLFEANAYFMLTSADLSMGAWVGYDNEWKFGPLRVKLSAWMEGRAKITFKPAQAEGELTLQGDVQLKAFGRSIGLNVAAGVQVQTPNPFFVYAEFRVKLNLPWPLPDPKADVVLEWKEEVVPPIPVPLAKFGMEHLKVSEKWTLDRYPEYDNNADGFSDGTQIPEPTNALQTSPVIPLDGRPVIVFAKPVEDAAMIGDNPMPPPPPENVGEGYQYQYRLVKVVLEKTPRNQNTGGWTVVGVKSSIASENVGELYGNWQIAPDNGNQTNTKLMFWTSTPFEISRELSNSEIFTGPFIVIYNPCNLDTTPTEICIDFEQYNTEPVLPRSLIHDDIIMANESHMRIINYHAPWCGTTKALDTFKGENMRDTAIPSFPFEKFVDFRRGFNLAFSEPVAKVALWLGKGTDIKVVAYDDKGDIVFTESFFIPLDTPDADMRPLSIEGENLMYFTILGRWLFSKICYISAEEMSRVKNNEVLQTHIIESTQLHWDQHKNVLFEPNMYYKLTVVSEVIRNSSETFPFIQHCYFQTDGPPGVYSQTISGPGVSLGATSIDHFPADGPLKDLAAYINDTIPKIGQKPVYRSYDIGVTFNEPYIDQMYLMTGMPLSVELFDNNDLPVLGGDGIPISLQNQWGDNPQVFITREEEQWIVMLDQRGCITLDYQHKPRNRNLYSGHKRLSLKQETLYKARITAISNADSKKYVVFQFSFITSKYASFTDQIHSFQDVVWSHGRLLGSVMPLLTSESKTILEDILSSVNPENTYESDSEDKKFQQINELFGLGIRQLPKCLEILALDDNSELVTENSRSYGFLIESPEPIDWNRTSLTASFRPADYGTEPIQEAIEVIKILGAGTSFSGGETTEYNNEWIDLLLREEFDISNLLIEHKSVGSAEFQDYFRFETESELPAGTVIRVHTGMKQDDINSSLELEHRYIESNNWHFLPAGEMIRISDKEGNILNSRYIAPETSYISRNIILIRNADNTRAFVFLPSTVEKAGPIDNGNYIFSFRYRLNIGDNKPILKRLGGIDADEETYIEFSYPAILP